MDNSDLKRRLAIGDFPSLFAAVPDTSQPLMQIYKTQSLPKAIQSYLKQSKMAIFYTSLCPNRDDPFRWERRPVTKEALPEKLKNQRVLGRPLHSVVFHAPTDEIERERTERVRSDIPGSLNQQQMVTQNSSNRNLKAFQPKFTPRNHAEEEFFSKLFEICKNEINQI